MTYSLKKLNNRIKHKTHKHYKLLFKTIRKSKKNVRKHKSSSIYAISNPINKKFIPNKHKHILAGGNNDNILFGCTTLDQNSTLTKNFELINKTIRTYIPADIILNTFLLYKSPSSKQHNAVSSNSIQETLKTLKEKNYHQIKEINHNIMDFIKTQTHDFFYRMIVLTECSNLLATLLSEKILLSVKFKCTPDIYNIIDENIFLLYSKIVNYGYLINFFLEKDNKTQLTNIDNFMAAFDTTRYLPLVIYSILIMKILYKLVSTGIYKKINDIYFDDYKSQCSDIKTHVFETINKYITTSKKVEDLVTIMSEDEEIKWIETTKAIYSDIVELFGIENFNTKLILFISRTNYVDTYIVPCIPKRV